MEGKKIIALFCLSNILLWGLCNSAHSDGGSKAFTAILGAFGREVEMLEDKLTAVNERRIEGMRFVTGKLKGKKVVLAWTGIGKVNAAMTTTLLLEHFRPEGVIFTGIAGGVNPELWPGDIVIAKETAHHDMGVLTETGFYHRGAMNPFDGFRNPVFLPADKRLLRLAGKAGERVKLKKIKTVAGERTPKIIQGAVVTGDVFVASAKKCAQLRETLQADAVEMEGAAVAQICYQQGIPCLVIRSISDKADDKAVEDSRAFRQMAAENSASLIVEMLGLLRSSKVKSQDAKRN